MIATTPAAGLAMVLRRTLAVLVVVLPALLAAGVSTGTSWPSPCCRAWRSPRPRSRSAPSSAYGARRSDSERPGPRPSCCRAWRPSPCPRTAARQHRRLGGGRGGLAASTRSPPRTSAA
ncbi:hypothetical protein NKH77_52845 [Streptomyces sp. M19]